MWLQAIILLSATSPLHIDQSNRVSAQFRPSCYSCSCFEPRSFFSLLQWWQGFGVNTSTFSLSQKGGVQPILDLKYLHSNPKVLHEIHQVYHRHFLATVDIKDAYLHGPIFLACTKRSSASTLPMFCWGAQHLSSTSQAFTKVLAFLLV